MEAERKFIISEHYTRKDGEEAFEAWKVKYKFQNEDLPFKVKTGRLSKSGSEINLNVQSWGFFQASDWSWYFFVSYRTSDQKQTIAYHWHCNQDGLPSFPPTKHLWTN